MSLNEKVNLIPTEGLNDNVVESNGELLKETNDDNNS